MSYSNKFIRILLGIIPFLLLLFSFATIVYAVESWTNTGSMNIARADHTATLLSSGNVLVAGSQNLVRSTETYNSSTGAWSYTSGSMNTARYFHTAHDVTISGGLERVLVIGGVSSGMTATTELFSTSSGTWSYGANMHQKRAAHASVKIGDGTVLVIGGDKGYSVATPSVELYDPGADTWTVKHDLITARKWPTATLLNDGTVFIAGGTNTSNVALSSTEIYDPTYDTITSGPTMSYARGGHTATLLPNGKVLIAGGSNTAATKAEVYDPGGNISNAANMTYSHVAHTATLITLNDGTTQKVLVAGSAYGGSTNMVHAELYDYVNDSWSTAVNLNYGRYEHTATLLNGGMVLVTGGIGSGGAQLKNAELYTAP
jgi:hypothetical protein